MGGHARCIRGTGAVPTLPSVCPRSKTGVLARPEVQPSGQAMWHRSLADKAVKLLHEHSCAATTRGTFEPRYAK